jgi:hypothetical protein
MGWLKILLLWRSACVAGEVVMNLIDYPVKLTLATPSSRRGICSPTFWEVEFKNLGNPIILI